MLPVCELPLGTEPDAVRKARRFTAQWFADEPRDLVDDAEQVVSELVTNAIFHGAEPITLRLSRTATALRLEVEDAGRTMPVISRASIDTMTGRGLSLIAALASGWGVSESPAGKVVWAEITGEAGEVPGGPSAGGASVATGLDLDLSSSREREAEPRYPVRIGAVTTELLLAAKAHIDNVVREMTLLKAEQAMSGAPMPEPLARLVQVVTEDFAEARAEIKRQALAAANRGEAEVELVLNLPLAAADAGERYLEALDAADRYARAARLLTVSAPVLHRVFRRWYVEALIEQLRAAERGEPAPPPSAFPEALATEVERLSSLDDTWDRLQLLQRITRELTGAATVADIIEVIVRNALGDLNAQNVRVYLLGDDGVLRSAAVGGNNPAAGDPAYHEIPLDADLPGAIVVRTGTAMYFRNREQLTSRFPQLAGIYPHETSLHVAPLRVGEHTLGLLTIAFGAVTDVDEETQVQFVGAMADALAQAFERALAMEHADAARRRLAFLAEASVVFAASLDFEATLDAVNRLLVPTLADWCIVQLQVDGTLEIASLHHSDPGQLAWAKSMQGRFPLAGARPGGAPTVVATGESQLFPKLEAEVIAAMATSEEHRDVIRALGMSSAMVVPLTGRSGTFGAITLLYADSGRQYAAEDVSFVEDVARRAALALETAETFRAQSGRLADVRRVAEATQRAILAPVPPRLGAVSLAGRYVSASAEALIGGDLYEVVPRAGGVRLLVGDVRGKGLAAIRVATIVLGEFRAAAADLVDLADVAKQMDRRLRPYLSEEDFATAVVAEVGDDGAYSVVSCGHPAPQLFVGGSGGELSVVHALPLGLGAAPTATTGWLNPGDRLLLYTDGVNETRDENGKFVDLNWVAKPLESGELQYSLDEVLERLQRFAGRELADDVALLAAEYRP
ncbi:MAG TPA: SpoIIE family protein phosphatase [Mycobacteriales bacterium]|nr:SpoIIE family protein phosphatase [Mycobacteriales bacterium]